jgi:hypothetical protein
MTCWCGKMFCGTLNLYLREGERQESDTEQQFLSWACLMRYVRAKAAESKHGGRCPECVGVGIIADGTKTGKYCACETGRDLERVQRRMRIVGDEPRENTWEAK